MKNSNRFVVGEFPMQTTQFHEDVVKAYNTLYEGTGEGAEMRGWLSWPKEYRYSEEYGRLKETAKEIIGKSDAVVVVGIGGSYLTTRAVITAEYGDTYNETANAKGLPRIYFAGNDLSPDRLKQTLSMVAHGDWSIIYISKSGGTIEPALAFRTLYQALCDQYGDKADSRIYAVTDSSKGILKGLANEHCWESFVIPDNIGGRFSGLTACGLLPIAVAGIDTDALLNGAIAAQDDCNSNPDSFARQYAEWRYANSELNGMVAVEFFAVNDPYMSFFAEWLKQLFGESEGKDGKGLFPASGVFPTDLHSLGQYLQEGLKDLIFETFIIREFKAANMQIPKSNLHDNLQEREGKTFSQAAEAAMDGAFQAHTAGENPCGTIYIGKSLEAIGYFMQAMFVACGTSAYAIGVNPFNQPGVERHKAVMKNSSKWDN